MDTEAVPSYVAERLSRFGSDPEVVRLPGGNLNVVWRVTDGVHSVIVKHAPPYIAANPDVPLDPSRLVIEGRCLEVLGPEGQLSVLSREALQAPRLIDMNRRDDVLIMEDVGAVPTLDVWLRESEPESLLSRAFEFGTRLGEFIGRLHATTLENPAIREAFDNQPMQETRHAVQYEGVAEMLSAAEILDAETLAERAERLGAELMQPGRCLTMGDLWPPSVLVADDRLRLIDWELAHFGRPLQDVAHWLAHLWMQKHRAQSEAVVRAIADLRSSFLTRYREAIAGHEGRLWPEPEKWGAAVHFGAEILVRAVGPFQDGYVYEGLGPDHPDVQDAVATAAQYLRDPAERRLFEL